MIDFFHAMHLIFIFFTLQYCVAYYLLVIADQAKLVYQCSGDKTRIIMDDLSEYQCNLQSVYPPPYQKWSEGDAKKAQLPLESGMLGLKQERFLSNGVKTFNR